MFRKDIFLFEWFEQLRKKHQTNLIVVNNEEISPNQEVIDDLVAIIHVFSCRVYGLKKHKKKVGDDVKCK